MTDGWDPYYVRRDELIRALLIFGPATCRKLAILLGWSPDETRGKLMSMRSDGLAVYDGERWTAI
jgi:hypothetical protein